MVMPRDGQNKTFGGSTVRKLKRQEALQKEHQGRLGLRRDPVETTLLPGRSRRNLCYRHTSEESGLV